nr:hypothetical protein [Tanacetum cinerariifolium]
AMMVADCELAARLQEEDIGELSIEEKSRLFMELMNKRKKHFVRLRAEKIRKIQMLFNNTRKWIEAFVLMDTELVKDSEKSSEGSEKAVEGSEKAKEGSSKRAGSNLEQGDTKREDLEVLWSIVKVKFKKIKPVDDMDNLLFQTLNTMFEHQ